MEHQEKPEHEEQADRREEDAEKLEQHSDTLGERIDDIESDWESKEQDPAVPGAQPDDAAARPEAEDAQSLQPESLCLKVTAIRAAINDNPNVPPDRASLAQRCPEAVAAVVTREKDEMFHQGRVAHCVNHRARKRDMAEKIVLRTMAPLTPPAVPP